MSQIKVATEDGENSWGHLKPFEYYAAPDQPTDFERIPFDDSFNEPFKGYRHAAHAMLYARIADRKLFDKFQRRGAVLMQVRFDGYLGFPGGLIDPEDTSVVFGLNRELFEEAGLDESLRVEMGDHFLTDVNRKKQLILHFFIKEVSLEDFNRMEQNVLKANEYGFETLGIVRVPCYVLPDQARGLPIFLTNKFIGQARQELTDGLVHAKIFTRAEMDKVLQMTERCAAFKSL